MQHLANELQKKSLEMVNGLVKVSGSAFFLVGQGHTQHWGTVVKDSLIEIDKEYTKNFSMMDPLNPDNFTDTDIRVATIDSQLSPHILKQTRYYQDFMIPNNHRYVADIFLRNENKIIAVLSLLREESMGDFTKDELAILDHIQPFLEFTLNSVYLPRKNQERADIREKYGLTGREIEVAEMVLSGSANKQIAKELNLGLATVKTHLHHIFKKAQVESRSELVAKLLSEAKAPH